MSTKVETPANESRPRLTLEEWIGVGLVSAMTVVLFAQVVARFIFHNSITWSEELARYLFIWMNFLLLGSVTLRARHLSIDLLEERLSGRSRRIHLYAVFAVSAIILAIFIYWGMDLTITQWQLGQVSAAMGLPKWIVYAALPVGFTVCLLRLIQACFLVRRDEYPKHVSDDELEGEV